MEVTFLKICELFEIIETESSRNEMTRKLSDFLHENDVETGTMFLYLLDGRIAPQFVPIEFNFSEKSVINGMDGKFAQIRKEQGDIGLAMYKVWEQPSSNISLKEVYLQLWELAKEDGKGSVERKTKIFFDLAGKLSKLEVKYLSRIVVGKLRMGLNIKSVLDAISIMMVGDKSKRSDLDIAYGFNCDVGIVLGRAKEDKEFGKNRLGAIVGIPFFPKLVQRVADFNEILERMPNGFFVQPKYDGLRCQIHKNNQERIDRETNLPWQKYFIEKATENSLFTKQDSKEDAIKIFSRNLEDITEMFPEIVQSVKSVDATDFILDGEIIAIENDKFLPFQETMTRKRKYNIEQQSKSVPVKFFTFDCVRFEGENVAMLELNKRVTILEKIRNWNNENIKVAQTIFCKTGKELRDNFDQYTKLGHEGLVIKDPTTVYTPAVRNYDWIKLKKSMEKKLVDTLDLVVVGWYAGSGKRTQFGIGALLMAIYNEEQNLFEPITKLGTGINDKMWDTIKKRLLPIKRDKISPLVKDGSYEKPDAWVEPEVVCTVEADEISKSSVYDAGKDKFGYGLGLRFPRLIEFDRDKLAVDATEIGEIRF